MTEPEQDETVVDPNAVEDNPDAAAAADAVEGVNAETSGDAGEAEVQAVADVGTAQGYLGARTDPTPLHHYSLPGVVDQLPTPETDYDAAVDALKLRVTGAEGVQPPA